MINAQCCAEAFSADVSIFIDDSKAIVVIKCRARARKSRNPVAHVLPFLNLKLAHLLSAKKICQSACTMVLRRTIESVSSQGARVQEVCFSQEMILIA